MAALAFVGVSALRGHEGVQGITHDYVPEGRDYRRVSIASLEQCQAACERDAQCKAFAFRTRNRSCYLYSRVYQGGSKALRALGARSSGLSIVPRAGFVSAF